MAKSALRVAFWRYKHGLKMAARNGGVRYNQLHHFIAGGPWDATPLRAFVSSPQKIPQHVNTFDLSWAHRQHGHHTQLPGHNAEEILISLLRQGVTFLTGFYTGDSDNQHQGTVISRLII
jgi:hypothetical protein